MIGIFLGAAILGGIIALMQESDFPGWVEMIICVVAAMVPTAILAAVLPGSVALLAPVGGAVCAAIAISATCGMTIGRAVVAAVLWMVAQIGLQLGLSYMVS